MMTMMPPPNTLTTARPLSGESPRLQQRLPWQAPSSASHARLRFPRPLTPLLQTRDMDATGTRTTDATLHASQLCEPSTAASAKRPMTPPPMHAATTRLLLSCCGAVQSCYSLLLLQAGIGPANPLLASVHQPHHRAPEHHAHGQHHAHSQQHRQEAAVVRPVSLGSAGTGTGYGMGRGRTDVSCWLAVLVYRMRRASLPIDGGMGLRVTRCSSDDVSLGALVVLGGCRLLR